MNIHVANNEAQQQYEALVDGRLAVAQYTRSENTILFHHTEVPSALRGRGVGGALGRSALDDARDQALIVESQCWFVSAFIRDHPEYLPMMSPADRERLQAAR